MAQTSEQIDSENSRLWNIVRLHNSLPGLVPHLGISLCRGKAAHLELVQLGFERIRIGSAR